jgi:hypothetical protein
MRTVIMLLAVTFVWLAAALPVPAGPNIIPRELVEFAEKNGCAQVEDFFDTPGMINPPFVYGYLPGAKDKSAVFWCQTVEKGERQLYLVLMFKEETTHEMARCPRRIRWENPPRGLDLYNNPRESLGEFVFLDASTKRGPGNVRMTHNAIRSEIDGVSEVLYCYQGRWLVRYRH